MGGTTGLKTRDHPSVHCGSASCQFQPLDLLPRRGPPHSFGVPCSIRSTGVPSGTGSGTISEFDPTALQPSWTRKPADPRRVRCLHIQSWVGRSRENGWSPRPSEAIDRSLFTETLDECHVRSGFRIWQRLLKGDRAHLFVGTPSVHPVAGRASLQNLHRRRLLAVHPPQRHHFGDRHPSTRFESGHASAIGNRPLTSFLTRFPFRDRSGSKQARFHRLEPRGAVGMGSFPEKPACLPRGNRHRLRCRPSLVWRHFRLRNTVKPVT